MKKGFKRLAAWTLAAVMAIQTAGTAMAWSWGTPSIKTEGKTVTVTFDAGEGKFEQWKWLPPASGSNTPIATQDKATLSKASVKVECTIQTEVNGTETVYYGADLYNAQCELWSKLRPSYLRSPLSPEEIAQTEPIREGYGFGGWYMDKDDPGSKVPVYSEGDYDVNCYLDGTVYEDCTLYARWLKEAQNESSQVDDVMASGLKDNETLKVRDLEQEEKKSWEQLSSAVKNNQLGYGKLLGDAVQLDLSVDGKSSKDPVTVVMSIPEGIDSEQAIVVIHFGKNETEVISPVVENGSLSFDLTSFSPVVIANAERTCKVEVKNVTGGLVYCYHELPAKGEEERPGIKFLPIGEISEVPYGTELEIEQEEFGEGENWSSDYSDIKITQAGRPGYYSYEDNYNQGFKVIDDTIIEGVFVKNVYEDVEGDSDGTGISLSVPKSYYPSATKIDLPITVKFYENGTETDVTNDTEFVFDNDTRNDNEVFEIKNNHLISYNVLPMGRYRVDCTAYYTKDGTTYKRVLRKSILIGYPMDLTVLEGSYYDSYYEEYIQLSFGLASSITESNKFKDAKAECYDDADYDLTNIQMYNYNFDDWYTVTEKGIFGSKATDSTTLDVGYNEASAKFLKGGKTYSVPLKTFSDNGGTPLPPDEDDNKGGSGSGSGSGKSSGSGSFKSGSSGQSNMSGDWKQNTDGWWFQKIDGSYAKSEWGQLNGRWYWFNDQGYMATDWVMVNNNWYYFRPDGSMESSQWLLQNGIWYYLNANGSMAANQWILTNGKWYYVNQNGTMVVNTTTPDGFQVDVDGAWMK